VTKFCQQCDTQFISNNKNQIYCCPDCRTIATKEKIMKRYRVSKAQSRVGKDRKCAGGCGTIISIYNNIGFCNSCMISKKKLDQTLKDMKELFDYEQG
jgi:hypothetical protein